MDPPEIVRIKKSHFHLRMNRKYYYPINDDLHSLNISDNVFNRYNLYVGSCIVLKVPLLCPSCSSSLDEMATI